MKALQASMAEFLGLTRSVQKVPRLMLYFEHFHSHSFQNLSPSTPAHPALLTRNDASNKIQAPLQASSRSVQTWPRGSLCSSDDNFGMNLALTVLIPRTSVKTLCTGPNGKPTSLAISLIVNFLSESIFLGQLGSVPQFLMILVSPLIGYLQLTL